MMGALLAAVVYFVVKKTKKIKGYMPVPMAEEEPQNALELRDFGRQST